MKLTYRGVQYNYNPPTVDTNETAEVGKFRGVDIRFRGIKKAPVQQPSLDLVYRGVAHRTNEPQIQSTPTATKPGAEDRARTMMMGHHRAVKKRQQAMLGRLAVEVGLPADAVNYWNHIQGKVHPSFWTTYDRSRAATS